MKRKYKIGNNQDNEIYIKSRKISDTVAEIIYERGCWNLKLNNVNEVVFVNDKRVIDVQELHREDIIRIEDQKIYWRDFIRQDESMSVSIHQLISLHGRIGVASYRFFSALAVGLSSVVVFLPGLISVFLKGGSYNKIEDVEAMTEIILPYVYVIAWAVIIVLMIPISVQRMRDSGKPIWQMIIPVYNIWILYFKSSGD